MSFYVNNLNKIKSSGPKNDVCGIPGWFYNVLWYVRLMQFLRMIKDEQLSMQLTINKECFLSTNKRNQNIMLPLP